MCIGSERARHVVSSSGSRNHNQPMTLTKNPNPELNNWSPFSNLRDHINRLFDLTVPGGPAESFGDWAPALDAFEDKDKYVVSVELPGLKKEDINVTVHDGILTVSGERKSEKDV